MSQSHVDALSMRRTMYAGQADDTTARYLIRMGYVQADPSAGPAFMEDVVVFCGVPMHRSFAVLLSFEWQDEFMLEQALEVDCWPGVEADTEQQIRKQLADLFLPDYPWDRNYIGDDCEPDQASLDLAA